MSATRGTEQAADIAALLRTRAPLLWIVSREEQRVEGYLMEAAASAGYVPHFWDVGQGVTDMRGAPEQGGNPDPGDTLRWIGEQTKGNKRGVWIMRDLGPWLAAPIGLTTCRQLRNLARSLPSVKRDAAQAIIVLGPSADVPPELANHATVIEWPLPDREEIARTLDAAIEALPDEIKESAAPNGVRDAAIDAAVGLSGEEAAACYARSLVQLRRIDPATVSKEKKRIIARERVMEWIDPLPGGLDAVGGLDVLKAWLASRKLAYSPAARAYGLPAPRGALLVGVPGCLHGDTPIHDPVTGDTATVAERYRAGQPFHVWSVSDDGPVVTTALPPQRYDRARMYRFGFDNGEAITVTAGHRFVSRGREIYASEVYAILQGCDPCLLETIAAPDLQAHAADGLRWTQTVQAYLDRCLRGSHQRGERPLSATDTDQASAPSPNDALGHTPSYLHEGDWADAPERSHSCLSFAPPSTPGYQDRSIAPPRSAHLARVLSSGPKHPTPDPTTCLTDRLSSSDQDQSDTAEPLLDGANPSMPDVFSSRRFTRVRTAEIVADAEYYDFHVPEYENYWACGVWHHNCGKSLTAKAIATAWGVPLLRLDLGALKSKFVGESEGNLRRALRVIETIGRCVVWLDEAEKGLAGATQGAADGGVSSDALGTMLSWMQEHQSGAFVVATANDVSTLPPELMRKGRFDELWFIDLPNRRERHDILFAALKAHGRHDAEVDYPTISDATEEFTGSEIAAIVPDALFRSFADGARQLNTADLLAAAATVVPLAKTAAAKIDALRGWAAGKCRPATTLETATPGTTPARALDF